MNTLTMTFLNKEGKKYSLRVQKVRTDITETEVQDLMDTILTKNLFFEGVKELDSVFGASINREEDLLLA
ncbi:DUF2922 domain-containing protein [Proteiniclasticum sp. BAD-10]|uniref:DUF2922 domain-containing protein n=1 Tax=Proteiniclasticum sediminis TaxID=2804028 RepID=A0A941CT26_9CLOT|nr:DUF2922 domain-containing protein [Proteiniclasticum sediminis]MBR0577054.1 DUF2922 domain-containing protein [Proteiniclasticum sediminis]